MIDFFQDSIESLKEWHLFILFQFQSILNIDFFKKKYWYSYIKVQLIIKG